MNLPRSLREWIAELAEAELDELIRNLPPEEARAVEADWPTWAHDGQCAPAGEWRSWVIMAGRGFGKTLAGSQWVLDAVRREAGSAANSTTSPFVPSEVEGRSLSSRSKRVSTTLDTNGDRDGLALPKVGANEPLRIALVGATIDEARRIMVEGKSGLLNVAAPWIAGWHPSRRLLKFTTGAEATLFSGASPEALRGPEHHLAWCDELAKWEKAAECWDMLQLGLRLGRHPRALITTTPRPGPVLTRIMGEEGCVVTGGATHANPHLPDAFVRSIETLYAGTRLGEQEVEGRLLPDRAGALWTVEMLAKCRLGANLPVRVERSRDTPVLSSAEGSLDFARDERRGGVPSLTRIIIGVDPPSGEGTCGIVVCALDGAGTGHVLADHSVTGRSPEGWARVVADAARLWSAPPRSGEVAARRSTGRSYPRYDLGLPGAIQPVDDGGVASAASVAGPSTTKLTLGGPPPPMGEELPPSRSSRRRTRAEPWSAACSSLPTRRCRSSWSPPAKASPTVPSRSPCCSSKAGCSCTGTSPSSKPSSSA